MRLISVAGAAGAGKDTLADIIYEEAPLHGYIPCRMRFADPIKEGVKTMFGLTTEEIEDRVLKETPNSKLCGRSPRQTMQWLGTEFGRGLISANIWIQALQTRVKEFEQDCLGLDGEPLVILSDCRFINEAFWTRKHRGEIILVRSPQASVLGNSDHVSEQSLPDDLINVSFLNDHTRGTDVLRLFVNAVLRKRG